MSFVDKFFSKNNTKFNKNPSSSSRVVLYGRTNRWTDGLTDMTKLIVALHKFANTSNDHFSKENPKQDLYQWLF